MTTDRPGRADEPWQRRWAWNRRVSPRWLLVGQTGTPQFPDDEALALCADIDGLFIDLPPRPRERFTLLGCMRDGALASLLDSVTTGTACPSERGWATFGYRRCPTTRRRGAAGSARNCSM
ncbi:hypothetical protein GCM10029978_008760 [Actinoallomurus acanthiterrae]